MAAIPTPQYYISEVSFDAEAGENISSGSNPTATLIISPAPGYTLTHTNFSIGEALPSEVASAVFLQDGDNVNCLITFDAGFTMPSSDVELLIDIDGTASAQTFTASGVYYTTESNTTTTTSSETAFSGTAEEGTEVTLFTKTFTADPDHVFNTPPFYYQDPSVRTVDSDYIITYSDISTGSGRNNIVTSRTFTVKYIIKDSSETLKDLYFTAEAEPVFIAPAATVNAYKINLNDIGVKPETRTIDFFGGEGAQITFNYTEGGSVNESRDIDIPAKGVYSLDIEFPNNLAPGDKTWTFTLSGDLESPFAQDNPFTITQLGT